MLNAKELLAELQEMRDGGFLSDALIRRAVRGIGSADERYDWVGAFLLREGGSQLWLHNYVGIPSEEAEIPVGSGVIGGAVAAGENQLVVDADANGGRSTYAPEMRSELAVLIRAGSEIFGVLTLGSEEPGKLRAEDQAGVETVADKLAEQLMAERR